MKVYKYTYDLLPHYAFLNYIDLLPSRTNYIYTHYVYESGKNNKEKFNSIRLILNYECI